MKDKLLISFTDDTIILKGTVILPITIGRVLYCVIHIIDFLIIDSSGAYNIILGRLFLMKTQLMMYFASDIILSLKIDSINIKALRVPEDT